METEEVTFYLEIFPEEHCDYCGEIYHNHIDCPVCKDSYAGTDRYSDLFDMKIGEFITCDCGAEFTLQSGTPYDGFWSCDKPISENE